MEEKTGNKPLNVPYVDSIFRRHADKLGFDRNYFNPHRYRRYYKTILTGNMTDIYVEFTMGHKIKGISASYFDGTAKEEILAEYLENQKYLTVFTEQEVLQQQYDDLVQKSGSMESIKEENKRLQEDIQIMQHEHTQDIQALLQEIENMKKQQIEFFKHIKQKYEGSV